MNRPQRIAALTEALAQRLLVLDGAMGTALQALPLGPEDFGGRRHEGCPEALVFGRPEVIRDLHAGYLEAGADIIETDSFGATPLVLAEYGLADQAEALNEAAARLARQVADHFATPARPRFVAGSMGPTTRSLSLDGREPSFAELAGHYLIQARGLHRGGVDYFLLETCPDTLNIKAALCALEQLVAEGFDPLPVAVSATLEPSGALFAGQSVEALLASLDHVNLLYLGLNCGSGPEPLADPLRTLSRWARWPLACVPNAGLPDETGRYRLAPDDFARAIERFAREGWLNLAGGCCGAHRDHVAALATRLSGLAPRRPTAERRSLVSGLELLDLGAEGRPVLVGERTNVLGSRRLREQVAAGRFAEAAEVARSQVAAGAQLLDVAALQADRDEVEDLARLTEAIGRRVRVPLMIDSLNPRAVAAALMRCQGKTIINSVNLEDGGRRLGEVATLCRRFGAALVVGCIDERGQGLTVAHKLQVARRAFRLLTGEWGLPGEDLYFDALTFPCATGEATGLGAAARTLEAVRRLKRELPRARTLLGISNVSFGLPPAARELVNAVFLHHAVEAGLDLAIVNPERLERFASLPAEVRAAAERLLFCPGPVELLREEAAAFAARFAGQAPRPAAATADLPVEERLTRRVVEARREGLAEDLAEAMEAHAPLALIDGPLMRGMDEVGRLFRGHQIIVAEVLQSAEVMRAAVALLEPHLAGAKAASRGRMLLATVKGDVHDIGKNLVQMVFANNGFEVIDLGTQVSPERLLAAVRESRPDLLGLSGLLIKSTHQMVATAQDLAAAGVRVPLLVGGAALSRAFVEAHIAPAYGGAPVGYASDAMHGLALAQQLLASPAPPTRPPAPAPDAAPAPTSRAKGGRRAARLVPAGELPEPPDFEPHLLEGLPLDALWAFLDPVALYGRHLGLKGPLVKRLAAESAEVLAADAAGRRALALREAVESAKAEGRSGGMRPRAVYRFFSARSEGTRLHLFAPEAVEPLASFDFPREPGRAGRCLADWVAPLGGPADSVCLFVTTAGEGVAARAEALQREGALLKSHLYRALALQTAEAFAEMLHSDLRRLWGFPDDPALSMGERRRGHFRGQRYSPGWPAWPRLEDQRLIFRLLDPGRIGVRLTEGCMMDPEASVSALVLHHPQAVQYAARRRLSRAPARRL